jgi:AraC family transcriptional regulator
MPITLKQITQGSIRRQVDLGRVRLHEVEYPGGFEMEAHSHESGSVSCVISGGLEQEWEDGCDVVRAGSVMFKRAGVVHSGRVCKDGMRSLVMEFEDETVERGTGMFTAEGTCATRAFLVAWGGVLERGDETDAVRAIAEVFRRMSRARATSRDGEGSGCADDARELILADLDGVRSFEAIALELGVHPVSLARAFRRRSGVTMSIYRRRARVALAAELLAGSARQPAEVAQRAGFHDQSHMTRAFGLELGVTPVGYRRLARL